MLAEQIRNKDLLEKSINEMKKRKSSCKFAIARKNNWSFIFSRKFSK